MKSLIGLLVIFCISGLAIASNTDFTQCKAYLDIINDDIQNKRPLPKSFQLTMLYSGKMLNDQGDVGKCRELEGMTFVRQTLELQNGLQYYKGYCLVNICNAEVLNNNQAEAAAELAKIQKTINDLIPHKQNQLITLTQTLTKVDGVTYPILSFVPYQDSDLSMANAAFIIAVMSIALVILCAFIGPILKMIRDKSENAILQDNTRYQTLINYNQQGATSIVSNSNSQISRPSHTYSGPAPAVSMTNGHTVSQVAATTGRPKKEPMWWRVVQCWNLKENLTKMFTIKSNNDDLLVFNGIRSICFMQVIFGHEFYLHMNYMSNPNDLMVVQEKPFILFLFSCLYSVDVFFWLGGFFLAYVVADEKQQRNFSMKKPLKVLISFTFAVINRIFRILPCYFIVLMFFWKVGPFMGSSPTWDLFTSSASRCDTRWWQNLLFIDNMFPGQKEKCFGWGWYLSNDFQMFIVGMILLIVYQNNRFVGKILIGVCFAAFQAVSIALSYKWEFKVPCNIVNLGVDHYYDDYYTKPWTRVSPYFIGLFFGILYKEHQFDKSKGKKNCILTKMKYAASQTYWKYLIYAVGFAIYFFLVFGPRALQVNGLDYWSAGFQHFWFGTCRTFYVVAVTLLVIPGMLGSKDLIVQFFNCKLFGFLQRLSFGGYLTHYIIILYTLWDSKDAVYYDSENLIGLFFSEFLLTLIAAGVVALIIEIPIMNLSAILLGGKKPSSSGPQRLERVKLEELTQEGNTKSLNINKSQISDGNDASQISNNNKSITVQSKQMKS